MTDRVNRILVVDDDAVFRDVLARALIRKTFSVYVADNVSSALELARTQRPHFAVVDLKMPGESGLSLVPQLRALDPAMRILVLTGFASIATAVEAIKLGATHYLAKPADADQIVAALGRTGGDMAIDIETQPLSVDRLEWEHIQTVLAEHEGNVSATARALKMHRRTLQRKLAKKPALR